MAHRSGHRAGAARQPLFRGSQHRLHECARANLGIAIGQRSYIEDDLASGRLVQPFDTIFRRDLGYYLVCPADRADAPKIKLFREWLLSGISAHRPAEQSPRAAE
jgi:DNA-binding transcriptional LysR family regulator